MDQYQPCQGSIYLMAFKVQICSQAQSRCKTLH